MKHMSSFHRTPLDKQDTKEFRDREARAMRLAQEIERSDGYKSRMDLENGDGDEEMAFSAVVRPDKDGGAGPGGSGPRYIRIATAVYFCLVFPTL